MSFGFGLAIKVPFVTTASPSYRPPSWPPPRDWACIVDADGNTVSRWGDPIWHLYPWAGSPVALNFGDGPKVGHTTPIDRDNADLLRLLVTWRGWGRRGARSARTLKAFFTYIRAIIELCSREGILASELTRFPAVMAKVPQVLAPSGFDRTVSELQRVLDARLELGFLLLDQRGLRELVAAKPEHDTGQTEYIPPRIWTYQVNRLRECLDDYMAHRQQVEDCFNFCVDAYNKNFGSLAEAVTATKTKASARKPFQIPKTATGAKTGCVFHGPFRHTAARFGILELLGRWVGEPIEGPGNKGIARFSSYLSLVQYAALAYQLNFSLMRYEEGKSLRADCLYIEEDDKLGKIPILCGETTKTDPDSDARWPTSPSAKVAVDALTSVSRLRMICAQQDPLVAPSAKDIANPYLFGRSFEPWAGVAKSRPYSVRPISKGYGEFVSKYPKLFDANALKITEEDLRVARSVTPTLKQEVFQVGMQWPLAWHQLRRTGAVNMFSSGTVSDSTMQFLMKHLTRAMPLYYGRGSSTLNLNEEARVLLINAQYEVMGREIAAVLSERFVSPFGEDHKKKMVANLVDNLDEVNILSEKDVKRLEDAARRGAISFRATVLGACMSNAQCDGDCIESIADCSGGHGGAPCLGALFDRQRVEPNQKMLNAIKFQIKSIPPQTPRYIALEKEQRGLENYFAYVNGK